ncbi:phosphoribosylaminoimidazolesuccinocarboxamide synthase [Candidatus Kaiserbacteria bacterium]|nr:phosphoribosylaminoimidazolesuccinocarboxamide synthase [Candidatus Kaiserbacteria bacterium]
MIEVLKETNFSFLGKKRVGKVRDIYEQQERLILVSTDRHSSFDRIIAHIPHKGQILNQVSAWWFAKTADIVPNQVIAVPDPNVTVARKYRTVAIEAVMRGYLTGVTDTAIWTRYQKGQREFGTLTLPDGMKKNQKLPMPVFDPTTKEDTHDRALTPAEMVAEGFVTQEMFDKVKATATALFLRGQEVAEKQGLILVDTKYEFGVDPSTSLGASGSLVLIDEIHTPDSSRFWQLSTYAERFAAGKEPEYFDKEFLRLWFKEHCDPYKDKVLPEAPAEMVEEMSRRYITMYEQMTGETFAPGEEPISARIENNLKPYAI